MAITGVTNLSGNHPEINRLQSWNFDEFVEEDKRNYYLYKSNPDVLNEKDRLRMQVLDKLYKVKFPKDSVGTSFYASVVTSAIYSLMNVGDDKSKKEALKAEMKNAGSSFYHNVAHDFDCKSRTLHEHIGGLFSKFPIKKIPDKNGSEVWGTSLSGTVSYGELAFAIANETLRTINKSNKTTGGPQFVKKI